jgi:phosphatidylglycerol---prolipoprotein diacylglyceryl transferase
VIIINPVAFNLGLISIYWYGIIIGSALLIGLYLAVKEAERQGLKSNFILDFSIYAIPVAIICARIYYVLFSWDIYKDEPFRIIAIWEGGIAIHGAIIGGLIVLWILCLKKQVSFWQIVDILSPSMILGQAIGRWGNFINKEAYGGIVTEKFISIFPIFIQKQMYINGEYHHPTFLYESIWNILVFLILICFRRNKFLKNGDIFLLYIILYSIGRFFIEGMRMDSLMIGIYRVAQLLSILIILIAVVILYWKHKTEIKNL